MTESESPQAVSDPGPVLRWPPPGLERMQGDMGQIAARAALAGGLLVLPILFVVGREQSFATLGPFADAWWVALVLASVGLTFSMDALIRAARMLRRAAKAIGRGYEPVTVVHVLADVDKDMGFLLQGARHFAVMDERERGAIAHIRVFNTAVYVLAGLWLSVALAVGLLAAARGLLSPSALWMSTLLPALALYAFGAVGRLVHDARVRRARRAYHNQPWSEDLASEEVDAWRSDRAGDDSGEGARAAAMGPALSKVGLAVGLLGLVVALPILTLMPTSVVGPVLTMLATPQFDRARQRAAQVEGFRSYVVESDPSITAQSAGQLLHDITHAGADFEPAVGEKEPSRRIEQPWLPATDENNPMGIDPFEWGDSLLEIVGRGTTGAQRAYLAQVASHPWSGDFSSLASAADLDAASARWVSPFPMGTTLATMPIPRFTGLRQASQVHIGAAAYEVSLGQVDRAETLLKEVISVGFLMGDHGPTLIDNFIGFSLVENGANALEDLYLVTGQADARADLVLLEEAAARAASLVPTNTPRGAETWVRTLPDMVLDSTSIRGLRWEYFMGVATLTPCLNLHRMVFGPDDAYRDFIDEAHDGLVRWPSEEGLFEIAKGGWLGAIQSEGETWLGRLLSVSMRRGESSCGEVVRKVETAQALF